MRLYNSLTVVLSGNFRDEEVRKKAGEFLAEELNSFLGRAGLLHKCRKQYYSSVGFYGLDFDVTKDVLNHMNV